MEGMENLTLLGWVVLLFTGWAWERIMEGKFKNFHELIKGSLVFGLCLLTGAGKVLIENNFDPASFSMGDWLGYTGIIFLASQAVWEARKNKLPSYKNTLNPPDIT